MGFTRLLPASARGTIWVENRNWSLRSVLSAPHATLRRATRRQFDLSIGCLPLRLSMTDGPLLSAASIRYAAFAASHTRPFTISLDEGVSSDGGPAEFTYELEGAALHAGGGRCSFAGVRNEYALDSLLRIQLSCMLLQHGGFLLHAASVVRNNRAYVFTGRSGAGKSTVASLASPGSVLTDEISLLRFADGGWRAYGTPFWGEFRAAGCNVSAPVAGVFHLAQAAENCVTPLRPAEFLRALLPNVLFFSTDPGANKRLLDIVGRAAAEISAYTLAFRKDRTFWEVLPQ